MGKYIGFIFAVVSVTFAVWVALDLILLLHGDNLKQDPWEQLWIAIPTGIILSAYLQARDDKMHK